MNALIPTEIDGHIINQREVDGYFSATGMCKAAGKLWANYWRNDATQAFLDELSTSMRISIGPTKDKPDQYLINSVTTGKNELRGTWVHPLVATHLAQWLSPKFSVAVTKLVTAWMDGHRNPEKNVAVLFAEAPIEVLAQALTDRAKQEKERADKAEQKNLRIIDRATKRIEQEQAMLENEKKEREKEIERMRKDVNSLIAHACRIRNSLPKPTDQDLFDTDGNANKKQTELELIQGGKQYGNVSEWFGEEMQPSTGGSMMCQLVYNLYWAWCRKRRVDPVTEEEFGSILFDEHGIECSRISGHQFYVGLNQKRKTKEDSIS